MGTTNKEKVNIPIYDDHSKHETMFILIKRFNIMVDDGDLFFENTGTASREEANRGTMTAAQRTYKLNKIKEVYRTFRFCLLGKASEKWLKVINDAPEFDDVNNYEAGNTLSVTGFEDFQKELVERLFEDELIENTKAFLINTPKPKYLSVEDYISRIETINNYIPLMAIGAVKYTERELIRSVIMQRVPSNWRCSLLRAGNNNVATIESLTSKLIPIETADNEEQKRRNNRNEKRNNKGGRHHKWNNNRDDRNNNNNYRENDRGRNRDRNERENNQQSRISVRSRSHSQDSYSGFHRRNEERERDGYIMEKDVFATYGNLTNDEPTTDDESSNNNDDFDTTTIDEENNEMKENKIQDTYPMVNRKAPEVKREDNKIVRASIKFTLPHEDGSNREYLGLLDTGSTHNLLSIDVAQIHNLPLKKDDGI